MLQKLLRRYLAPYKRLIAIVVLLQLVGTIASLYLPSLNADIIDKGVVLGDTGYIVRSRRLDAGGVPAADHPPIVAVSPGPGPPWPSDGTCARAYSGGRFVLDPGGRRFGAPSLITRNTNDVQQVQMLVIVTFTMMISAPIMLVGGVIMALREDIGLSWLVAAAVPILGAPRLPDLEDAPGLPANAEDSTRSTRCSESR